MKKLLILPIITLVSFSSMGNTGNNIGYSELELYSDLIITQDTKEIPIRTYEDSDTIASECSIKVDKTGLDFENDESYVIPQGSRIKTLGNGTEVSGSALNVVHYTKFLFLFPGLLPFTKTATKNLTHKNLTSISCSYTKAHGMQKATPISDKSAKQWMDRDLSNAFRVIPVERSRTEIN